MVPTAQAAKVRQHGQLMSMKFQTNPFKWHKNKISRSSYDPEMQQHITFLAVHFSGVFWFMPYH
jgi:hypothetical protein